MITVLCWGGIGDTLRNIALVPHEAIYRRTGIRTRVVYKSWRDTGCLSHALPPEADFYEHLIGRVPSLEWRGESGEHRGAPRLLNRALRELLRTFNGGVPRYYPFEFRLTEDERGALPGKPAGLSIGIQTHLTGMLTKRWGFENWRRFLNQLADAYPAAIVTLLDSAAEVQELRVSPNITTTLGFNIAQSIAVCRDLDLIISIDSWSKYVGAWQRIPQIIVVPDQRAEYPGLTASKLVHEEFAGIFGQPQNTLVGLAGTMRRPELVLREMSELSPDQLVAAVRTRLNT
jgi:ADP-heptose:LPS heptosyltransferase